MLLVSETVNITNEPEKLMYKFGQFAVGTPECGVHGLGCATHPWNESFLNVRPTELF